MKDQDNTTSAICYCKDKLPLKKLLLKEESREIIRDAITNNNSNIDKSKPWSVFGEWYWI